MRKLSTDSNVKLIILLTVFLSIQLANINNISLWDIDEGRYLITAQNAITYGKWLTPEYNGEPRITKPPLTTWIIAISAMALNQGKVSEWVARIPIILASIMALLITFKIVSKYLDNETAINSVIILGSSNIFLYYSRSPVTDMFLLLFNLISFYLITEGVVSKKKIFILASSIFLFLGFMTKGPVGILLPVVVAFTFSWSLCNKIEKKDVILILTSIFLSSLFSLIWPIMVGLKSFVSEVIVEENVKRFSYNFSWESSPFYYIGNVLIKFSPWSIILPKVLTTIKEKKPKDLTPFAYWFFTILILFSLSTTKRSSYILFSYPALSAISGYCIKEWLKEKVFPWKHLTIAITLFFVYHLLKILLWRAEFKYIVFSITVATFLVALTVILKGKPEGFFYGVATAHILYFLMVYQPIADRVYHSPKKCMTLIADLVGDRDVYTLGSTRANELFYLKRRFIKEYSNEVEAFILSRKTPKATSGIKKLLCCEYEEAKLCLYRKEK